MSTEYSISVDDWTDEKWNMTGKDVMYEKMTTEDTPQNKEAKERAEGCGCSFEGVVYEFADEHVPIMLYAYPLYSEPSEDEIVEICEKTNCTVVEDNETNEFYLALTGGGMDLSQDIALAYLLAGESIPSELAVNVSTQYGLIVEGDDWFKIMDACKESLEGSVSTYQRNVKTIETAIEEAKKRKS